MSGEPRDVKDRSAEIGINTGVLIQGVLLLVVSGFGYQISERLSEFSVGLKNLAEKIERANMQNAVSKNDIEYLKIAAGMNTRDIKAISGKFEDHLLSKRWESGEKK